MIDDTQASSARRIWEPGEALSVHSRRADGSGRTAVLRHWPASDTFGEWAAVLRKLKHTNTARILDQGVDADGPYVATEWVHGTVLSDALGEVMEPERVVLIAQQLCAALQEAHLRGITHGALHAGNVFLTRFGGQWDVVKVVDWHPPGPPDKVTDDTPLGTVATRAPERHRGGAATAASDVYAVGALMFRALTGRYPNEDPMQAVFADDQVTIPAFAEIHQDLVLPPAFEWTVRTCLAFAPEDRFADVAELSRALSASLLALEDPTRWNTELTLDRGRTRVPDGLSEATSSTSLSAMEAMMGSLTPPPIRRERAPAPEIVAAAEPPPPAYASLKWATLGALLMVPLALLLVVGVVVVLGSQETPAPAVSAAPPPVVAPVAAPAAPAPAVVEAIPAPPAAEAVVAVPEPEPAEVAAATPVKPTKPAAKPAAKPTVAATPAPKATAPVKAPAKTDDFAPKSDLIDPFAD